MLFFNVLLLFLVHSCIGAPNLGHMPHASPNLRIIDGQDALPHAAPYYAHIVVNVKGKMYYCAGSLIQNQYVLTAASCLNGTDVKVSSVSVGLYSTTQSDPVEKVGGSVFRCHENFKKQEDSRYDVAIIKLDNPVNITVGEVETAELPNPAVFPDQQAAYDQKTVTLYGWGRTQQSPKVVPDTLQTLDAIVVPYAECITKAYVHQDELCVGRLEETPGVACQGDSGGPLIERGLLIGIHSRRSSVMCSASYVGIYARVDYNLAWITKTIQDLSAK